jgi:nucleoid-associated protein YgaU
MFARWVLLLLVLAAALALAAPRPSSGAAGERRYVVRPGDTLWALASERFGGDPRAGVWEIRERNGLADALLEPGMVLYLPARAGGA